jgi:hypothetical protein
MVLAPASVVRLRTRHFLALVLLNLVAMSGCSSPSGADESVGMTAVVSQSGALRVTVKSSPGAAPVRGTNQIELAVEAVDTGLPVDGLVMSMVPFMPSMGHGTAIQPRTSALGAGRYEFANVVLTMPGLWELRTTMAGALSDYVAPRFDVE